MLLFFQRKNARRPFSKLYRQQRQSATNQLHGGNDGTLFKFILLNQFYLCTSTNNNQNAPSFTYSYYFLEVFLIIYL